MKVKINCTECRKKMTQISEENFLRHEYEIFENCVNTATDWTVAIALTVLKRKGFNEDDIKSFFDEFCMIANLPEVFGKRLTTTEVVKSLENEYGISFSDIVIHHENVNDFIKRYKKEQKELNKEGE